MKIAYINKGGSCFPILLIGLIKKSSKEEDYIVQQVPEDLYDRIEKAISGAEEKDFFLPREPFNYNLADFFKKAIFDFSEWYDGGKIFEKNIDKCSFVDIPNQEI